MEQNTLRTWGDKSMLVAVATRNTPKTKRNKL